MFNLLEDQFLDDAVFRAEQSRFSYTLQMEEFRSLNSNLQVYLNDIKRIDDENHQLQENIEQLRTNYVVTLESHLKRLPEDFRQESQTLTEAHLERYKSKSRAKRFSNEREELKKRIQFLVTNEKDQTKRLNHLEKQDRSVTNEFKSLNQQIQTLYHYVQTEKHNHQEAMNKVDHLQIQLEEICIQRSKTEFEIQTLREEVKLMQTAKEFLDEEHQTIVSTRTEANEYLLSRLNDAISRIREDFNELNKNQIKQFENEYQQMMKILEETPPINELIQKNPISYETLQDDYQLITQELTTLNEHHQNLSERILNMEADFYSIRDARLRELISKDNELERTEIELQTLNEKLNHLAEYDRNLQFELTLYRGVLESEYRRKQLSQNQQPIRPTTLRTTINRSHKNSPKISTNYNQLEPINEKGNSQVGDEKIENKEELNQQDRNITTQGQHQTPTETTESSVSTIPADQGSSSEIQPSPRISPMNEEASLTSSAPPPPDLSSSFDDHQISLETSNTPTSSTNPLLPQDPSEIRQSSDTFSEAEKSSESPPTNEEASLTSAPPVSSEDHQTPTDTQASSSSIPPPTITELPSDRQEPSITLAVSEDQPEDQQKSSVVQELSTLSPKEEDRPSDTEKSFVSPIHTVPTTDLSSSTLPDNYQTESDLQHSSNNSSSEQPILPESSNTPLQENRLISSNIPQNVFTPSQEPSTSPETQQSFITDEHIEEQPSSMTADEYRTTTGENNGKNQLDVVSEGYDNVAEHEEKTSETDEIVNDYHQSIELSTTQEQETDQTESIDEPFSSSDQNQFEKDSDIGYISSTGYYGPRSDSTHLTFPELTKESSHNSSLNDAEGDKTDLIAEVGSSTSQKTEDKDFDDNNESDLEAVMQDLRYVYRSLANADDLVEVNDEFPKKLIDRLEFGDHLIQTLFSDLLKKYIVQPATIEIRSNTIDWMEFRDILFPIITGRYMEEHIRKLFSLFDINKNGCLGFKEITELLELLQVENTNELAWNLTNENEILNVNEFIEAIKKIEEVKNNILPEEIEYKHWYIRCPTDEEDTHSISFEIPTVDFPSKITKGIVLLSRIFKRVGADVKNRQLDSTKPTLSMKITNEFIHNNIHISNDDLQLFIELYLNKKQNSDSLINWIEFRDLFLPFVNGGIVSKDDITRWFDILDTNQKKTIDQEQILHFLRLLQISNPEEILTKIQEIHPNNNNSWTLDEFIFALENIDEATTHLVSTNELITSFDLEWLSKNKF